MALSERNVYEYAKRTKKIKGNKTLHDRMTPVAERNV